MITLGIDTAGPATAVALWQGTARHGQALAANTVSMTRGHAEAVMPMVGEIVAKGLGPKGFAAITRVAALSGPGSFTGIRIGVAAARGLALAIGCPAVAVTAFEAAAALHTQSGDADGPFAIAFDAKRGQVYLQNFDASGHPLAIPAAVDLDNPANAVAPDVTLLLGSGAGALAEALARARRNISTADAPPRGTDIVARLGAGVAVGPPPLPLYLRPPDAKPQRPALARAPH